MGLNQDGDEGDDGGKGKAKGVGGRREGERGRGRGEIYRGNVGGKFENRNHNNKKVPFFRLNQQ